MNEMYKQWLSNCKGLNAGARRELIEIEKLVCLQKIAAKLALIAHDCSEKAGPVILPGK